MGVVFLLLCAVPVGILWHDARAFVSPPLASPAAGHTKRDPADTVVRVGIIGDSWACGRGLADALEKHLADDGLAARVVSFGHGGAKSRDILLNLLKPGDVQFSSSRILSDDFDYCVVVCGVNDTGGYIGADFYSFHVAGIAELLDHHGVFPIILEVPEFGIEESASISFLGAARRIAMRWLLHAGERDVIPAYRDALPPALEAGLPPDAYKLVSFGTVCEDYIQARHLYTKDLCHLSNDRLSRLGAALSVAIVACHSQARPVDVQP